MSAIEQLQESLDGTRERFLMALEVLPDEALLEPGAVNDWTVAELISVLTAWEAETVTALSQIKRSKRPQRLFDALNDPAAYDAARRTEAADRNLDAIFDDWEGARVKLEDWLSEFSDKALSQRGHYKVLGKRSLREMIAAATYAHEARFIPALEEFARRWAEMEEAADASLIPLSGVDLLTESDNGHKPDNK